MSDGAVKNERLKANKPPKSKTKKTVQIIAIILVSVIAAIILIAGSYVLYVVIQYYRIEDNQSLEVANNQEQILNVGDSYLALTYNIGFGAYSQEYSFFMDTGVMADGKKTTGKYGKGINKADVRKNTDGALKIISDTGADINLIQEADEKADRSYDINQRAEVQAIEGYGSVFASNFHSAYLFYPFNDPHGKTDAGIVTLSKYKISSGVRRSFPLDTGLAKFFDLDRCFSVTRLPVSGGKELTLINLHMSAYDEGGLIRAQQLEMLNNVLKTEYAKGNYVIAGGDFNHIIAETNFPMQQQKPEWVAELKAKDIAANYKIIAGTNAPTCRGADIPYTKDFTYSVVIDGFLVSDNIEASAKTIDNDFVFSDHNPVLMNFTLKA